MQLYIKSDLSLEELAQQVHREGLPTYKMELRDGLNLGGGEYFKFSQDQTKILLVRNDNEVFVAPMEAFPYYLYAYTCPSDVLHPLQAVLASNGIECELANHA